MDEPFWDAVVVGAGPNGLTAAVTLARAGQTVLVLEAADTIGGGARSAAVTLPGYTHDLCSAVHPLGIASPVFARLPLADHGLEWLQPEVPLAHPLDGGRAAVLHRSVAATAGGLGVDGPAWTRLIGGTAGAWDDLVGHLYRPVRLPRHPLALAVAGAQSARSASQVARGWFRDDPARALFAGLSGHSVLPFTTRGTAGFGLLLGASAHAVGWPVARGGSQAIIDALAAYLGTLGGKIETRRPVSTLADVPPSRSVLFDVSPRQLLDIAGDRFSGLYRRNLSRFRHGPGVCKVDWALDGPVPWAAEPCRRAGTVHVGGRLDEIEAAEDAVGRGEHPDRPFVLVAQQSVVDATRAPQGKHTLWGYCHVPNGSTVDMTDAIERQIERFAPGFRDRILARVTATASDLERYNANYIGGDIAGGAHNIMQLVARPAPRLDPHRTSDPQLLLCSASTPPGAGVHGLCGYHAARSALRGVLRPRQRRWRAM
ncbi:MAG TPA: NAD(P)/FAD-dependent oxidoreductase [Egibacteraceae bacterium]|nr:NAD(P)/FAD-dependent oxidoreductase [Egibacteraceae bacterium]